MYTKLQDTHKQRSLQALLTTNSKLSSPRREINYNDEIYIAKFNSDLLRALESEHKTKNSSLFTWRQNISPQEQVPFPRALHKKTVSNTDLKLEDITDANYPNDINGAGSPKSRKLGSVRATDFGFNPFQSIQTKKIKNKGNREFLATQDGFMTSERLGFEDRVDSSLRHKKAYSITRLQMNLLSNDNSPTNNVRNFEFMTNQFDRKNYTVNKIINQINAQNDMLDKEEIKDVTARKLQYVIGNIQLQKSLKPRTATNSMSRSKMLYSPKDNMEPGYALDTRQTHDKEFQKRSPEFSATTNNRKSRGFKYSLDLPDGDFLNVPRGARPSVISKSEECELRLINKAQLGQVIQRFSKPQKKKKKATETERPNTKGLPEAIGDDLREFEKNKHRKLKSQPSQRDIKTARFFVRVPSTGDEHIEKPVMLKAPKMEEIKKSTEVFVGQKLKQMSEDNIFNFGKYFKKRYLEKETPFEVSTDLRKRIKEFEKGLKLSARKSQIFGISP